MAYVEREIDVPYEVDRIKAQLSDLRIVAAIKVIALESQPHEAQSTALTSLDNETILERHKVLNRLIKAHSNHTCIVFTYLPPPPPTGENAAGTAAEYIKQLGALSVGLPPTVMMHGVEHVTTGNDDAM